MTVPQLKKELRERGLPVSGKKAALLERLEQADAEASGDAPEEDKDEPKEDEDDEDDEGSEGPGPTPPYGSRMPDPHKGKPEVIVDDEGRKRWLCLDGQYRRGDPDSIKCVPENFQNWLSEWVVAARTGQCEGKPQMTFLPNEPNNPGNPKGKLSQAGKTIKSEEVLVKTTGPDGEPLWELQAEGLSLPPPEKKGRKKEPA